MLGSDQNRSEAIGAMMNGQRLKNSIALVTGGSRGVGKGVAIGLAEEGATVVVTTLSSSDDRTSSRIGKPGGYLASSAPLNTRR